VGEPRAISYSEHLVESIKADNETLSTVLNVAAGLAAYLAQGNMLSAEERVAIKANATSISETVHAAWRDARACEQSPVKV
jgi:hypothetical protein